MKSAVKVGVIGCGAISGAYLDMAKKFPVVEITAVADLDPDRAKAAVTKYGVGRATSVEELIGAADVDLVLNLTVPKAHVPVALAVLNAGKHTYCEKPLGIDRAQGKSVIDLAAKKGLGVGCAPDTFLGAGLQTARAVIDAGEIGRPVAAHAFMQCRGHEHWHPSPEFYYEVGGGPMFDMGPYYLTALLNLLGPAKRVSGFASIAIPDRTITSQPKHGKKIHVDTPDHIAGVIEFQSGAIANVVQSFAVIDGGYDQQHPIIINGTDGVLYVPDPNGFDGTVLIKKPGQPAPTVVEPKVPLGYGRSIGLADLATAIQKNRAARADGAQAFAVLDLMQAFLDSSATGRAIDVSTPYTRPAPLPAGSVFGQLD